MPPPAPVQPPPAPPPAPQAVAIKKWLLQEAPGPANYRLGQTEDIIRDYEDIQRCHRSIHEIKAASVLFSQINQSIGKAA